MSKAKGAALLSERLLAALTVEVDALGIAPERERSKGNVSAAPKTAAPEGAGSGAKARVEAISLLTRTLEKLLELKRLEALAMRSEGDEDDAEAERLRAEMLKRLRAMDARRETGPRLFAPDGTFLVQEPER